MRLTKLFKVEYDRIFYGKDELSVSNKSIPSRYEDAIAIPADSLAQAEMIASVVLADVHATKKMFGTSRDALAKGYQKTHVNENEYRFSHNELTGIECMGCCVIPDGVELLGREFVTDDSSCNIKQEVGTKEVETKVEVKQDKHDEKT